MKKMILGALLLLASFTASAASVSIFNPQVVQGSGDVISFQPNGTQFTFGSDFNDAPEAVAVSWNSALTGAAQGLVDFEVSSTLVDWSLSIFDGATETVLTSNNVSNTAVSALFNMTSGTVYTLVMTGTAVISSFTASFAYPPSVSEVPLPAAVWLFGSVLMGGLAMRRRSQKLNAQAVAA